MNCLCPLVSDLVVVIYLELPTLRSVQRNGRNFSPPTDDFRTNMGPLSSPGARRAHINRTAGGAHIDRTAPSRIDPDELRELQLVKLRTELADVLAANVFWRERVNDVRTWGDFERLP